MKRPGILAAMLLILSVSAFAQDDKTRTFLHAGGRSDTKVDLKGNLYFHPDEDRKWNINVFAGSDFNIRQFDSNGDGFMDDPKHFGLTAGSDMTYRSYGLNAIMGVKFEMDNKLGGQLGSDDVGSVIFAADKVRGYLRNGLWHSVILDKKVKAYMELGIPCSGDSACNWHVNADYSYSWLQSTFGNENLLPQLPNIYYGNYSTVEPNPICRLYDNNHHDLDLIARFDNYSLDQHHWSLILGDKVDYYIESYCNTYSKDRNFFNALSLSGEYSYLSRSEDFGANATMGLAWYNNPGIIFVPNIILWYNPAEHLTLQLNLDRKLRRTISLLDHIYALNSGKALTGKAYSRPLEDSWNAGASASWYFGSMKQNSIGLDYCFTWYSEQLFTVYNSATQIAFHTLSDSNGAVSYEHKVKLNLNLNPFEGFDATVSAVYSDVKQSYESGVVSSRPLVNIFQADLSLKYSTPHHNWKFGFDATLYGPSKVWDFMKVDGLYENGFTPVYPMLSAQISKRIRRVEFFLKGENLTNYRQPLPIINASNPFSDTFDASVVWGPTSGIKAYGGLRLYFTMK